MRDLLLHRVPKDIDIATNARPEDIQRIFPKAQPIGRAFGVMLVEAEGFPFEVATFRSETGYADGRHPGMVAFTTAQDDAQRRDFTINGLFWDPEKHEVIDYVQGRQDLDAGLIRAIGDPRARFAEDHLRLLRAVRFAATLGFQIDPETLRVMPEQAPLLQRISAERIQGELIRILTEARSAGQALELLRSTGLLTVVLPEVAALSGVEQPPEYHPEGDVFQHTVKMLNLMDRPTPELALAVLFHDIGKPGTARTVTKDDGSIRIRFDGHAEAGAILTETILQRLRCSKALTEHVVHCVRGHMRFMDVRKMRLSTLRRLIMSPTFATELELHRLDCLGSHGNLDNYEHVRTTALQLQAENIKPPRLLRGEDVLAVGIPAGPLIRAWLEAAYDAQLEGRFINRGEALDWLARSREQGLQPPSASEGPSPSGK